ncbi:MAG: hypothetical protein AAGG51_25860 [Cyanobacteria bacterium P01_G01_bin.54]
MDINKLAWELYLDLRSEIKDAQYQRVELIKSKMTFAAFFVTAIGTLVAALNNNSSIPVEIFYVPVFIVTIFDLLIHNCNRKIYQIAQYMRDLECCILSNTEHHPKFKFWECYSREMRKKHDDRIHEEVFHGFLKPHDYSPKGWLKKVNYPVAILVILRSPARIGQIGSTIVVLVPTICILIAAIENRIKDIPDINGFNIFFSAPIQIFILAVLLILTIGNIWDFMYQYKRARLQNKVIFEELKTHQDEVGFLDSDLGVNLQE